MATLTRALSKRAQKLKEKAQEAWVVETEVKKVNASLNKEVAELRVALSGLPDLHDNLKKVQDEVATKEKELAQANDELSLLAAKVKVLEEEAARVKALEEENALLYSDEHRASIVVEHRDSIVAEFKGSAEFGDLLVAEGARYFEEGQHHIIFQLYRQVDQKLLAKCSLSGRFDEGVQTGHEFVPYTLELLEEIEKVDAASGREKWNPPPLVAPSFDDVVD